MEIEEEGDEEELYHVRLMFSFFEWTGENIRHSSQALLQGLRSAAGRGCSEVARVSGGLLQSFRQTTQGLDFSLLRAQFALLLESKGESKDDQIEGMMGCGALLLASEQRVTVIELCTIYLLFRYICY